jgi:hypothetical protein
MLKVIDRVHRSGTVAGIAAALLLLAGGAMPAHAGSGKDPGLQLAQARGPAAGNPPGGAPQGAGGEIERQIADLKKQLKITPQQEPQFNAFAEVLRNNAQEADQVMRQAGPGKPNAVEALKREQQFTETEANGLKRLVPALQTLYDSLSDQQKKVADQVIGGGAGGPGGPGGGAPGGPAPRGGRG